MKTALAFIAATRSDDLLHAELEAAASQGGLGAILALARARGFTIDESELRSAFAVDWGLRWARYQAR